MSSAALLVQVQEPSGPPSFISNRALSSTQSPAESDTLFTINDLLVNRANTIPDVPLVSYPATQGGLTDYVHYTAKALDSFAEEAAKKYLQLGLIPNVGSSAPDQFFFPKLIIALNSESL